MRRISAIFGAIIFLFWAPGIVAVLVPWWITGWQSRSAPFGTSALRVVSVVLILAGVPALLDSFTRFALQGLGTPAPVFPTRHLVITRLYHHVRNPMYVGVCSS